MIKKAFVGSTAVALALVAGLGAITSVSAQTMSDDQELAALGVTPPPPPAPVPTAIPSESF